MKKSKILAFVAAFSMLLTGCTGTNDNTKYVSKITFTADEGTTSSDAYDVILANDTASATATFTYVDAKATAEFSWVSSDTSKVTVSKGKEKNQVNIKAKATGEAEVYVTAQGKTGVVESNHLKVKVQGQEYKTNDDFPKAKTTYTVGGIEKPLTMNTIYGNQNAPHLDSLTEQHVLVVPFSFTDENLKQNETPEMIEKIKKTFFGTKEELAAVGGWESLASFYNTTSYGKSVFGGDVLPTWVVYPKTGEEFRRDASGGQGIAAAEYTRTWYKTEYEKANHGALGADAKPFTYYDANNDGFLDLVWIVYNYPTDRANQNWWAYVTYTSNAANKTQPAVKTLGWASIDWMNGGCGGYDPHTFIHETGHTYGLDDYYDYNHMWRPMGGVDFMDSNLGDHCMFSKWSLGWTSPWIVDDYAEITLRPGTTTGDCFIIPSQNYNKTVFDEYIMVELMAPVGLAERDYINGYESTTGYSQPGLRITHVDARVWSSKHDTDCGNQPWLGKDFRLDNSKGGRDNNKNATDYYPVEDESGRVVEKGYYNLIGLIESTISDKNWTNNANYNASNSTLFKKNHKFTLSSTDGWAKTFMPSRTNKWNKSKTITGWSGQTQQYEIDETMTFNYSLKVVSIDTDPTYGWVAKVRVTPNAY